MPGSRFMFLACTVAGMLIAAGRPARAGLMGSPQKVDLANGWNPDVAFDPDHGVYLVVWSGNGVSGRFIDRDGGLMGTAFRIDDPDVYCFNGYAAVAYNPARSEFLVTWDNCNIYGRRVRSPDGALQGSSFRVSTVGGAQRSGVAWASGSGCYFVVYSNFAGAYGQRVSGTGQLVGSELAMGGYGYPAVSYSPTADTFLATWDDGVGHIQARRVPANYTLPMGSSFLVTSVGHEERSNITHDDGLGRWLVQYQEEVNGFDQYVQFVNDNGTLGPGPFPSADRPEFEGETNLGCDIAFSAGLGYYLSLYGSNDNGIWGQLLDRDGNRRRARVNVGPGDFNFHSDAADSARDRFMTVYSLTGGTPVYYTLYALYAPVTGLSALAEPARIRLTWTQPADTDMIHAMIRFSTGATPAGPGDGTLAADLAVTPGTQASFLHAALDHNQTYYYAVFAYDGSNPIYAPGVPASAQPATPGDLDYDGDVDQTDFGLFQACLTGSGEFYAPGCAAADMEGNGDGNVDQDDFGVFSACMGGANQAPGC
jgi:hypothetical protein